jgi:hypothetical protein
MTDIIRFITHSSELVEIDEPLSEAGVLLDAPRSILMILMMTIHGAATTGSSAPLLIQWSGSAGCLPSALPQSYIHVCEFRGRRSAVCPSGWSGRRA